MVDSGHDVVDKFSPSGTYEGQLTGTPSSVFKPESIESESIPGVAVDPNGMVWIIQDIRFYTNHEYETVGYIDNFSDAQPNQYISARTDKPYGQAEEGLAVDGENSFYIHGGGSFVKLNSSGETLSNPFSGDEQAHVVAVDPVGQEVYLDNQGLAKLRSKRLV